MFSIIVATDINNVIGKNNSLLWNLPNDLKRFKEITSNHKIIMGRKTFESLPKILPNRYHIVLTKNKDFTFIDENVEIVNSFNFLIKDYLNSDEEIFIIGGGEIYNLFLPYAQKIYLTKLNHSFNGDAYFPNIDNSIWEKYSNVFIPKDNENAYDSEFIIYKKN